MLRLAIQTGWTLEYIASMPSAMFTLLQQYEAREPFGPLVDEWRAVAPMAQQFNMNRSDNAQPRGAADFSPTLARHLAESREEEERNKPAPKPLTPAQEAAALDALFGFK